MKHIMIMLSICFAMVIGYQQTTPAMESHTIQEVTVQEGDTLWDIAARSTGSSEVKELNNISNSGALTPGTKLKVPVYKSDSPTRAMDYMAQN